MKSRVLFSLQAAVLSLAFAPNASASTIWYVNGTTGSDSYSCTAPTSACKTIGHAISLAASGDSIMVAAATYSENLTIGKNLTLIGASATTTIIDGGTRATVVTVSSAAANVTLSQLTIQNGHAPYGGGIYNTGTLRIISGIITNNKTSPPTSCLLGCGANGGGVTNLGTLTMNNTTISENLTYTFRNRTGVGGGAIWNQGMLTVNNSTISGNSAKVTVATTYSAANGGGIGNYETGTVIINNSTITGNIVVGYSTTTGGGAIWNQGTLTISNGTVSGNSARQGAGIDTQFGQSATVQNSIVADNSGGNCYGTFISHGYNLSSDATCGFTGPGDLNSTDPKLGSLGAYGGPTETIPLLSGSPAIDGGNPNGCTDNQGNLLKTDQRGMPRPDSEDKGGCDIGAYESQSD
jgi:hypothetical protein